MKILIVILFIVLSFGCATATKMNGPNGEEMYHIACDGIATPWAKCYEKAGEVCLNGYFLKSGQESSGSYSQGTSRGSLFGSSRAQFSSAKGIHKSIKIECK